MSTIQEIIGAGATAMRRAMEKEQQVIGCVIIGFDGANYEATTNTPDSLTFAIGWVLNRLYLKGSTEDRKQILDFAERMGYECEIAKRIDGDQQRPCVACMVNLTRNQLCDQCMSERH